MSVFNAWVLFAVSSLLTVVAAMEVNRAQRLRLQRRAESTLLHCVGQRLVVRNTRTLGTATDCEMFVVKPAYLKLTEESRMEGKVSIWMVEPDDPRIASAEPAEPQPTAAPVTVPLGKA
jgi:hypothetical protein